MVLDSTINVINFTELVARFVDVMVACIYKTFNHPCYNFLILQNCCWICWCVMVAWQYKDSNHLCYNFIFYRTVTGDVDVKIAGTPCTVINVVDNQVTCMTGGHSPAEVTSVMVQVNGNGYSIEVLVKKCFLINRNKIPPHVISAIKMN